MSAGRRGVVACMVAVLVGTALAAVGPAAPVSAQERGSIRGAVTDGIGLVSGVAVDLFRADEDGNRAEWLTSTTTSEDGYEFEVEPGCYTVTFIAPFDRAFVDGSSWANASACLAAGGVENIDAALEPTSLRWVSGKVTDERGVPIDGITVDLFTMGANGERGTYLRSTTTGAGGEQGFTFTLDEGCYVLTFISNDERRFTQSNSAWHNWPFCAQPGLQWGGFDVVLKIIEPPVLIVSTEHRGRPREGIVVDLFRSEPTGDRGAYVTSARTDAQGEATFSPAPGCYVLTYIAPPGEIWAATMEPWLSNRICLYNDMRIRLSPVSLVGPPLVTSGVFAVVRQEGNPVPGIVIDVFEAGPDGTRGRFVEDVVTVPPGSASFRLDPGCWYLTFIAPETETFAESGTRWLNRPLCAESTGGSFTFEEHLNPRPQPVEILEIDEAPFRLRGQVDAAIGVDYLVRGEPGRRLAFEILELSGVRSPRCDPSLLLVVKTGSRVLQAPSPANCGFTAIWTIPSEGELVFGFRSGTGGTVPFEMFLAEIDYEDVEVAVSPGSSREVSGTISQPRDGIDYVVRGEPGQALSIARDTTCSWESPLAVGVYDAQGGYIGGRGGSCGTFGPVDIPADGVLHVRVTHTTGPIVDQPQPYALTISVLDFDEVTVAPSQTPVEFTGAVDVPLDGVDYLFDASTFDMLIVTMLDPGPDELCQPALTVEGRVWIDGLLRGQAATGCDGLRWTIYSDDASTIRVRLMGRASVDDQPHPPSATFRVRFEQVVTVEGGLGT